ncbi:signal peptidase I [Patescibacteria group bacterium]|nr:signal peptidase I [Patescibacteria group bacterium]
MLRKISLKLDREKLLSRIAKVSASVWLACILGVFAIIGYVVGIRKELFDKAPDVFMFSLLGLILLGCLAFLVGAVSFTAQLIAKRSQKKQNIFIFLIKLFFILAILPLYLLIYILKPLEIVKRLRHGGLKGLLKSVRLKPILGKAVALVLVGVIIFPIWIGGYAIAIYLPALFFGFTTFPTSVNGYSMLPTISDAEMIETYSFNRVLAIFKKPQRGDLVVFKSGKTIENGQLVNYLKRIIAVSGDEILIENGFVFVNGQALDEPYTMKPRSTFGGTFLEECKTLKVPEGYVFVLGDNRKRSEDSRSIGLIALDEINYILPFGKQDKYKDRWRDTSRDKELVNLPSFDFNIYYEQLNKVRQEKGFNPLKKNEKLEEAAKKRAKAIIEFNELNVEPVKSKYPFEKALREVGYFNIVTGEIVGVGYFEEEELINYWLEFETKETILNRDYQETGIAAVVGKINGCETQVIVQEFGGYVPPNYKRADIEGWKNNLSRLKEVQPSWARLKEYKEFYEKNKQDVDRINEIISTRIANISTIVAKMEANQWLSATEQKMIDQDKLLYDEQEAIATRLNSR